MKKILLSFSTLLLLSHWEVKAQRNAFFFHRDQPLYQSTRWNEVNLGNESSSKWQGLAFNKEDFNAIELEVKKYLLASNELLTSTKHGADKLIGFTQHTRISQLRQRAFTQLADYFFSKERYSEAVVYYENAGTANLSPSAFKQRQHNLALAYASLQDLTHYNELKSNLKLSPSDKYLEAVLDYMLGDYDKAKAAFSSPEIAKKYPEEVKFYSLEMDYLTGYKNTLSNKLQKTIASKDQFKYKNLAHQLLGQLYLDQENYKKANEQLLEYSKQGQARQLDWYRLAYINYQRGDISACLRNLEQIRPGKDKLSQQTWYLTALCHSMNDDLNKSYDALLECVGTNQQNELNAWAEFNLAKLSYKLGKEAWSIKQLDYVLRNHPKAECASEATSLLIHLLIKNGQLETANKWVNQTTQFAAKDAFVTAIQDKAILELNNNETANALTTLKWLESSQLNNTNNNHHLRAEALYRSGKYAESLQETEAYLQKSKIITPAEAKEIKLLQCYLYKELNLTERLNTTYKELYPNTKVNPSNALGLRKNPILTSLAANSSYDAAYLPLSHNESLLIADYKPVALFNPKSSKENDTRSSFIQVGFGSLSGREIAMGTDLSRTAKMPLYLNFTSDANKGKLASQEIGRSHAGIYSQWEQKGYHIDMAGEWDQRKVHYYGYNTSQYSYSKSDIQQRFNSLGVSAHLTQAPANDLGISYRPSFRLRSLTDASTAKENSLDVVIPLEKKWLNENLTTQLEFNGVYNRLRLDSALITQQSNLLSLKPSIRYRKDNLELKAGVYPTRAQKFHLLSDFSAWYNLISLRSQVGAMYRNTIRMNTFGELSAINPFLKNTMVIRQSKETFLGLAAHGNLGDYTMYSLKAGRKSVENMPFYFRDTTGDRKQFNLIYSPFVRLFDGEILIDYHARKNLYIGGKLVLQPISRLDSLAEAWQYVPAQLNLYQKFQLTRSIEIRSESFLLFGYSYLDRSEVVNKLFKNTSKLGFDFNLLTSFRLGKNLSGYLNFYNLLGTQYQQWEGYSNFGTYFMVGIRHHFKSL